MAIRRLLGRISAWPTGKRLNVANIGIGTFLGLGIDVYYLKPTEELTYQWLTNRINPCKENNFSVHRLTR
ncbi:hypothetical protein GCM10008018_16300 [Paenibacillus marchantiophytorum]|uniref:Uncharacterized protein n=1 Tax=Paenibacillus marchantiophytorum TaxID=1619310 RepID=A0ABQ2BTW9_9BACL|nr:hypothetical protein GCM10008018_16300 [Paenibacillus marchantiophytorum]